MGNGRRGVVRAVVATLFLFFALPGIARAQFWLPYAGDTSSNKIRYTLSLVGETAQAIETDHPLLARWLLWGVQRMVADCLGNLPDGEFRLRISRAVDDLEKGREKRALRGIVDAQEELRRLGAVWNTGGAEAKVGEMRALVENGRRQDAVIPGKQLLNLVRIDPAERCLEDAARMVDRAGESGEKGHGGDALAALSDAAESLRGAYLAARLTQVKILVAHAGRMAAEGKRRRPALTVRRASRKLRKAGCVATMAQSEALASIGSDLEEAHSMLNKRDSAAAARLRKIEERIAGFLSTVGPRT